MAADSRLYLPPSRYFHQSLNFCGHNEVMGSYCVMHSQADDFLSQHQIKKLPWIHHGFDKSYIKPFTDAFAMNHKVSAQLLLFFFFNITSSLVTSFRTLKGWLVDLCFICGLCFPLQVPVCIHVSLCISVCVSISMCAYVYIYIVCLQCVSQYYVNVWSVCICVCMCICVCCALLRACHAEWDVWVSFSLETREFVLFCLLLHNLDKSKLNGFIRKKWILQSLTVSVISSSLVNILYWREYLLMNHHPEKSSDVRLFKWSNCGRTSYLFKICLGVLIKRCTLILLSWSLGCIWTCWPNLSMKTIKCHA